MPAQLNLPGLAKTCGTAHHRTSRMEFGLAKTSAAVLYFASGRDVYSIRQTGGTAHHRTSRMEFVKTCPTEKAALAEKDRLFRESAIGQSEDDWRCPICSVVGGAR